VLSTVSKHDFTSFFFVYHTYDRIVKYYFIEIVAPHWDINYHQTEGTHTHLQKLLAWERQFCTSLPNSTSSAITLAPGIQRTEDTHHINPKMPQTSTFIKNDFLRCGFCLFIGQYL
jgi:hypothetical protein